MKIENFIALRYLRSPRSDKSISIITIISTIGIALGVTALIIVLSIMNGFERELRQALIGANAHLTISHLSVFNATLPEDNEFEEIIKTNIHTTNISPFIVQQALLIGKKKPSGAYIKAIDPASEIKTGNMKKFLKFHSDNFNSDVKNKTKDIEILNQLQTTTVSIKNQDGTTRKENADGIILGKLLARNLGVEKGDTIRLYSPTEKISPIGKLAKQKKFHVVGLFESGLSGYDETLAFIDLRIAQKIFSMKNQISGLSINIENPEFANEQRDILSKYIDFPYFVHTWIDDNQNLFSVIQLEKLGLAIILTLIILVAAFNIISSLIMLVKEKQKDVAILKAIGMKDKSILIIFITQGTFIGFVGIIFGLIGGIGLCLILQNFEVIKIPSGVYVGNKIPIYISSLQILLISIIAFLICFFVTIIPSKKAANMNPVEGLRYE